MANADDLLNDIENLLNAAPKGRVAKPATTVNRPKPAPEPAASIAAVAETVTTADESDDDEEAQLLAKLAAKREAKAAAARAAEEALAAAKAAEEAASPVLTVVGPFDEIDSSCWIAVVAQSGDVDLADSTVAALRLRRGV